MLSKPYIYIIFLPIILPIIAMDDALVAGPAIKNTKIAPAEIPLEYKTNAIGMEAVAQTYNGRETSSITKYSKTH